MLMKDGLLLRYDRLSEVEIPATKGTRSRCWELAIDKWLD